MDEETIKARFMVALNVIIDTVTAHADGQMTFRFQGGTEIELC